MPVTERVGRSHYDRLLDILQVGEAYSNERRPRNLFLSNATAEDRRTSAARLVAAWPRLTQEQAEDCIQQTWHTYALTSRHTLRVLTIDPATIRCQIAGRATIVHIFYHLRLLQEPIEAAA